jgi:hypothetical protein
MRRSTLSVHMNDNTDCETRPEEVDYLNRPVIIAKRITLLISHVLVYWTGLVNVSPANWGCYSGAKAAAHSSGAPTSAPTTRESQRDLLRLLATPGDSLEGSKQRALNEYGHERELSRISSIFLRRIVSASLTTSAMSRHTFSVQAAGAGSHKPKSWRRRPWHDRRVPSMSTLSAQSVSLHHDGVLHQTSLRSRWTMMTHANSLHVREAGRPINVAVTQERGPELTRAFPHGHLAYDCRASPRRQNSV